MSPIQNPAAMNPIAMRALGESTDRFDPGGGANPVLAPVIDGRESCFKTAATFAGTHAAAQTNDSQTHPGFR